MDLKPEIPGDLRPILLHILEITEDVAAEVDVTARALLPEPPAEILEHAGRITRMQRGIDGLRHDLTQGLGDSPIPDPEKCRLRTLVAQICAISVRTVDLAERTEVVGAERAI